MAQRESFVTDVFVAHFPKISRADTFGEYADGRFKTGLVLEGPEGKKLYEFIKAKAKELLPKVKSPKLPLKVDDESGKTILYAASKYRPPVFTAADPEKALSEKAVADMRIAGGTRMKCQLAFNVYEKRVNLYLNGVQIIELKQYESKDGTGKSPFGKEDGFKYEGPSGTSDEGSDGGDDTTDEGAGDDPYNF